MFRNDIYLTFYQYFSVFAMSPRNSPLIIFCTPQTLEALAVWLSSKNLACDVVVLRGILARRYFIDVRYFVDELDLFFEGNNFFYFSRSYRLVWRFAGGE